MAIGHTSLTNLRSEMIFLQGKPVFYIFLVPTIYKPILTDNPPILLTMDTYVAAKGKVGQNMNFSYIFRKAMIKPENDRKAEDVT